MSCELHKYHWPRPRRMERHHVLPQAWQRFWWPGAVSDHEHRASSLWDERTVECCPTGHDNVHFWLVTFMTQIKMRRVEDPLHAKLGVVGGRRLSSEQAVAFQALTRWREAGGSLLRLVDAGQMGRGTRVPDREEDLRVG